MKWNSSEKTFVYALFNFVIVLTLVTIYNQILSIDFANFNYGLFLIIFFHISIIIYFTIFITKRIIEEKIYKEVSKERSYFVFLEEQNEKLEKQIELIKKYQEEVE